MKEKFEIIYENSLEYLSSTHYHNENELVLVTEGSSEFKINSRKYCLGKNSMIIIGNLEKHSMIVTSKKYERYIVKISPYYRSNIIPLKMFIKIFQKRPSNFPYIFSFNEDELEEITLILNRLVNKDNGMILDEYYTDVLLSQLFLIIIRNNPDFFSNKQSELEEEIFEIQEYINKNYTNNITLDDLEREFYISKYTISREFKVTTGYNFKTYLILLRISKAKDLLVYSNKTVREIADEVGYDVDNVFIRIFKKYEGLTPTEFKNKYRN